MNARLVVALLLALVPQLGATARGQGQRAWQPRVHDWVEIEGHLGQSPPLEIVEVDEAANPGVMTEISAPLDGDAAPGELSLLSIRIALDASTVYEDRARAKIARPALPAGTWVKVKAKRLADASFLADTVRLVEPRGRFKIEAEVLALPDDATSVANVGGIAVRFTAATDLTSQASKRKAAVPETVGDLLAKGPLGQKVGKEEKFLPYTFELTRHLYLGGELFGRVAIRENYNFDNQNGRDRFLWDVEPKLSALAMLGDGGSFALLTGHALRGRVNKESSADDFTHDYRVSEAYLFLADTPFDHLHLQLGRQDFDEVREWIYNESLDGARAYLDLKPLQLEVSATAGRKYLDVANQSEEIYNFMYVASYGVDADWTLSGYVIDRRDQQEARAFSPFLYGLRSYAKPGTGLRHWVELARADGVVGFERLDGYGVDFGCTYVLDHALRPNVTLGYALGTGDRNAGDNRAGFRQSGLQDNNGKFAGVTSFRYYGEILDPEPRQPRGVHGGPRLPSRARAVGGRRGPSLPPARDRRSAGPIGSAHPAQRSVARPGPRARCHRRLSAEHQLHVRADARRVRSRRRLRSRGARIQGAARSAVQVLGAVAATSSSCPTPARHPRPSHPRARITAAGASRSPRGRRAMAGRSLPVPRSPSTARSARGSSTRRARERARATGAARGWWRSRTRWRRRPRGSRRRTRSRRRPAIPRPARPRASTW
ncbi:MAG: DUF5666 domain-containing protein [Planctomycetota bacterium]